MRSTFQKVLVLGLSVFSLSVFVLGCSEDTLPKYVALGDLRILALAASAPEVDPGASVTITPYLSDIGNTGPLQFAWQACVDAGVGYGATPTCEGNPTATAVTTGAVSTLNAGNTYTAAADGFSVSVPATVLTGRSDVDQYNGVAYLVMYSLTNVNNQTVKSFKRIIVSTPSKLTKNQNPGISAVLANGAAFASLAAGTRFEMSLTFSSSPETYQQKKADGLLAAQNETYQTTWFYSDGETKYYRTTSNDANQYTTPASFPAGRSSFLVIVLRDDRGGVAVTKAQVN
jgi:hypothetical protein